MSAVKPQRKVAGQKGQVWDILYLPDGRRTITCSEDGSLRVWDLESGKQEGENWEDKDSGTMWAIALSPGGKEVASGSDDGIVRLWDIETGKVTARWTGHGSEVASICWSPDGGQVVSGSSDGTARMWNVESGETILEPIKTGHMCVRTVHYSPDATMIATGGNNSNGQTCLAKFYVWLGLWMSIRLSPGHLTIITTPLENSTTPLGHKPLCSKDIDILLKRFHYLPITVSLRAHHLIRQHDFGTLKPINLLDHLSSMKTQ